MNDKVKLIQEKIKQEEFIELIQLKGVKQNIFDILTQEKGFIPQEIDIDPVFRITSGNCEVVVSIDFIINVASTSFMVIRSIPTAIESWERYTISFARAIKDYQIPYAVVTDGEKARIFYTLSGALIRESIDGIFQKQEAVELMKNFKKIPCPAERLEKEKRIIYAFEGIKCPPVQE